MAKRALLRMVGVATFAIASAAPWQYEADLVAFVAELVDADVIPVASRPVANRIEQPARDTPAVAIPTVAPAPEPAPDPVRTHGSVEVVTVAPGSEDHVPRTLAGRSQTVLAPRDRAGLGLALQRELKRVGCYDGELNGAWTPATRRAMLAFTQRLNAMLPTEQPDHILLALVQGHETRACGVPCPAAQALGPDGLCTPTALLAVRKSPSVAAKAGSPAARSAPPAITWSSTRIETGTSAPGSLANPMGLAGPRAANPADAVPARPWAARPAGSTPRPTAREPGFGPSSLRQLDGSGF